MSFLRILAVACAVAAAGIAWHRQTPPVDDHMAHMSPADLAAPLVIVSESQGIAGLPPSNNSAPARLKASPRHGEWVKIAWEPGSKDSLMAWIVYPKASNPRTQVGVVLPGVIGLWA